MVEPYEFNSCFNLGDNCVILPVNIAFALCLVSTKVSFRPFLKPYSLTLPIKSPTIPSPSASASAFSFASFLSWRLRLLLANVCSLFFCFFSSSVWYLVGRPRFAFGGSFLALFTSIFFGSVSGLPRSFGLVVLVNGTSFGVLFLCFSINLKCSLIVALSFLLNSSKGIGSLISSTKTAFLTGFLDNFSAFFFPLVDKFLS